MIYGDSKIEEALDSGDLVIDPLETELQLQPASVDLRLGNEFSKVDRSVEVIDPRDDITFDVREFDDFVLDTGEFTLATTKETIKLPDYLAARVVGRSSIGRLGIVVHATAGYIDPGFRGKITLELHNTGWRPVSIPPGTRVCQLVFEEASGVQNEYDGKYQHQDGTTGSRLDEDVEFVDEFPTAENEDNDEQ